MSDVRTFVALNGARWIRLTGHDNGAPIWLIDADVVVVTRHDGRPVGVKMQALPDDQVPEGVKVGALGIPTRLGDRPVWITAVHGLDTVWHVAETVEEVLALLQADTLPEPAAIPIE